MFSRILIACSLALIASAQPKKTEIDLPGSVQWRDTGIDVQPGDSLRITATGTLQYSGSAAAGPEGLQRGWRDLIRALPVNDAGRGALVGRISDRESARAFYIGAQAERTVAVGGRLFIGINHAASDKANGQLHVTIEKTAASKTETAATAAPVVLLTQKLLDSIPLRVNDAQGTLGDRVNFVIVGSQEKVQAAFKAAGWVTVDRTTKDAIIRGILSSLSREAYVTMPMSELMLFGRVQDFAYAQGDPLKVVAARHHFRLWRAPFDWQGQPVWAGAGTHDVGFDRDQRNNGITHKIDPEVDKEREYIGQSLNETGMVAKLDYMMPANAIREAKTAHGEAITSDGRTLIIYLKADTANAAGAFSDLFCSVLKQKNPDGGSWNTCDQYIDARGREDVKLDPLPTSHRVLIVPGILSSCVSDSPAFQEGQQSLRDRYGMTVELLGVPNDSSEDNARMIAQYLKERTASDPRKYIVIGYSKGAPDVQVALARHDIASSVAAFITVAGASGGSPVAATLPAQANQWIQRFNLSGCKGDLAAGFASLRAETRRTFLSSYPRPFVPTYSLAARSEQGNTSKALLEMWKLLTSIGRTHDGQLLVDDAIVPEAKYLGVARGDHFAVALPFDKSQNPAIRLAMDQTRYPRAALLEALVRFAVADLAAAN